MELKTGIQAGYDYDFELSNTPLDIAIPW